LESLTNNSLDVIDAFSTKEIQVNFNSNLDKGQYRVDALVFYQGKEIAREKMVLTVNEKPAKAGPVLQPQKSYAFVSGSQIGVILITLGLLIIAAAIVLYLTKTKENTPDYEKRIVKLLHQNKLLTVLVVLVALLLMATGILIIRSARSSTQKPAQSGPANDGSEVVDVTSDESRTTGTDSGELTDVKGMSTQSEDPATLLVRKPSGGGNNGFYPVYNTPDFDSEVVYQAVDGETFDVVGQADGWYNVRLEDGAEGWLHETSIKSKK